MSIVVHLLRMPRSGEIDGRPVHMTWCGKPAYGLTTTTLVGAVTCRACIDRFGGPRRPTRPLAPTAEGPRREREKVE